MPGAFTIRKLVVLNKRQCSSNLVTLNCVPILLIGTPNSRLNGHCGSSSQTDWPPNFVVGSRMGLAVSLKAIVFLVAIVLSGEESRKSDRPKRVRRSNHSPGADSVASRPEAAAATTYERCLSIFTARRDPPACRDRPQRRQSTVMMILPLALPLSE